MVHKLTASSNTHLSLNQITEDSESPSGTGLAGSSVPRHSWESLGPRFVRRCQAHSGEAPPSPVLTDSFVCEAPELGLRTRTLAKAGNPWTPRPAPLRAHSISILSCISPPSSAAAELTFLAPAPRSPPIPSPGGQA